MGRTVREAPSVDSVPTADQTSQLDWIAAGADAQTGWWEAYVPRETLGLTTNREHGMWNRDALSGCQRVGWIEAEEREYVNPIPGKWARPREGTRYRLTSEGKAAHVRGAEERERKYERQIPSLDAQLPVLEGFVRDEEEGHALADGWIPALLPDGKRAHYFTGSYDSTDALLRYGWTERRDSVVGTYHGTDSRLTKRGRRALERGRKAAERKAARDAKDKEATTKGEGRRIDGHGVGDPVSVSAFGRMRPGVVTGVGKTRLTVRYLKNQQGDRHTAAFPAKYVTARTDGPASIPE